MNDQSPYAFMQGAAIFLREMQEAIRHPRTLMALPCLVLGVFLISWFHTVAPFVAAVALALLPALELQFNNIFYRGPAELEAFGLYPVQWRTVVIAKNLATVVITLVFGAVFCVVLAYFAPALPKGVDILNACYYFATVLFPLLYIGNEQSLSNPRRIAGWRYEDFMEMLWMAGTVILLSIPFMILTSFDFGIIFIIGYAILTAFLWWLRSVPHTAAALEERFADVVEQLVL